MSFIYVTQPDGKFAIYCTITGDFQEVDFTRDQLHCWIYDRYISIMQDQINTTIENVIINGTNDWRKNRPRTWEVLNG